PASPPRTPPAAPRSGCHSSSPRVDLLSLRVLARVHIVGVEAPGARAARILASHGRAPLQRGVLRLQLGHAGAELRRFAPALHEPTVELSDCAAVVAHPSLPSSSDR